MDILKWTVVALVALAVIYGGLVTFGAWRWSVATGALITRLDAGDTSGSQSAMTRARLRSFPRRFAAISS